MHSHTFSLMTLAFCSASSLVAAEENNHLFILSGQSNMAGLDPNISFTPSVEAEFGKEKVTVVKYARGGQPIRCWYKQWKPLNGEVPNGNGRLYNALMKKINEASEGKDFSSVTFVWMQGERDAKEKHGEVYAASMRGLIKQLTQDLGRKEINFVLGRLSDFDMEDKKYQHWTMIRKAQVEVAESSPLGTWVNTDDLNEGKDKRGKTLKNDLHYSIEGYKILGKRFAEKSIELIKKHAK